MDQNGEKPMIDAREADKAAARREALRKLGTYGAAGAVAAPALLAVLSSDRAQAQTVFGPPITGVCTVSPTPDCTFF